MPKRKRTTITTFHVTRVRALSVQGHFRPAIVAALGISYSAVRAIQLREGIAHPGFAEYLRQRVARSLLRRGVIDGATVPGLRR